MSEFTMEEAKLDIDRDYYDVLAESDNIFAPYVKHLMARYWDSSISRYYENEFDDWKLCKEVLTYVLNPEIPGDNKVDYLVKFHEYVRKEL